jgi:hypothetical protein
MFKGLINRILVVGNQRGRINSYQILQKKIILTRKTGINSFQGKKSFRLVTFHVQKQSNNVKKGVLNCSFDLLPMNPSK